MPGSSSIDIVIPSYRLDESVLLRIIQLQQPANWQVFIYIIADNHALQIPAALQQMQKEGRVQIIINERNMGVSASRNIGIGAGSAKWILFLDDDIIPGPDLLFAYTRAITKHADAIGFVGVVDFPKPFNAATLALEINGSLTHFSMAKYKPSMIWAPTANIVLNRNKMHPGLFDTALTKSGEDIDFLVRNSLLFDERYIAVPDAMVVHPWWNSGSIQTGRLFRYGEGGAQIAMKSPVKAYTYRDFTNTAETLLLLVLVWPLAMLNGYGALIGKLALIIIAAEFLTNWLKVIIKGKLFSPVVTFYLLWIKNCYEAGYLYAALKKGHIAGFGERVDLGFARPNPSPFRLNRWKIIKLLLITLMVFILIVVK
jgi:glycosyltransferase involved in cell wall biosynthesis